MQFYNKSQILLTFYGILYRIRYIIIWTAYRLHYIFYEASSDMHI